MSVVIERVSILSETAGTLIAGLNAELSRQYPEEGATHFRLDADEVSEGKGAFLIAYRDEVPVGCGALRRIEDGVGELKRMYVAAEARGAGVGKALLAALEAEARALGMSRLVLETGTRQEAAMGLYYAAGFTLIAQYGEYVGCPLSVCMGKDL
jgi:putative acetyltransferase